MNEANSFNPRSEFFLHLNPTIMWNHNTHLREDLPARPVGDER